MIKKRLNAVERLKRQLAKDLRYVKNYYSDPTDRRQKYRQLREEYKRWIKFAEIRVARYAKIKAKFVQEAHGFRVGGLVHSRKPVMVDGKSIGTGPFVVHTLYSTTGRMTLKYSPGGKIIRDKYVSYYDTPQAFYPKYLYPDKFMDRIHEIHNKEKEIAATP